MMKFEKLLVSFLVIALLFLPGCTTMHFSGEKSNAVSLEMSNVDDSRGISFTEDDFEDHGFYFLQIVPISEPDLGKMIGNCSEANSINITTEQGVLDILFQYAESFVLLYPWVNVRGVEVNGAKTL